MSEYVVAEHYLDTFNDVYRLTIGVAEEVEVPVLDENGEQAFSVPLNGNGNGEEPINRAMPERLTTIETRIVPVEDFAFVATDPRWAGKDPEAIAAEQREIVVEALAARERDAEQIEMDVAARTSALPGVGEPL
jgi:hypothetical protein